jgi:uncharacterized membrane protein
MKAALNFLKTTLLGGFVFVLPAYISVLLIIKTFAAAGAIVQPISSQLPESAHFRTILAILLLLGVCFAAGLFVKTAIGRFIKQAVERNLFERVPGYAVFRGLAQKLTDERGSSQYSAALAVIEDALVPACIVEKHADGTCTVFVPSAPTPAMGSIYILPAARVYEVDVPLVKLAACVSKWGAGCGELLTKMKDARPGGAHMPVLDSGASERKESLR